MKDRLPPQIIAETYTQIQEFLGRLENTVCLVCVNPTFTWYDVMKENCGKTNEEILRSLCGIHRDIFKSELKNVMKEKSK